MRICLLSAVAKLAPKKARRKTRCLASDGAQSKPPPVYLVTIEEKEVATKKKTRITTRIRVILSKNLSQRLKYFT